MSPVRPLVPLKISVPLGPPWPAWISAAPEALAPVRVTLPDWWMIDSKALMFARFSDPVPPERFEMKLSAPVPPSIRPLKTPPCQVKASLPAPRLALVIEPVEARVTLWTPVPVAAL